MLHVHAMLRKMTRQGSRGHRTSGRDLSTQSKRVEEANASRAHERPPETEKAQEVRAHVTLKVYPGIITHMSVRRLMLMTNSVCVCACACVSDVSVDVDRGEIGSQQI